jgi:cyclase
MGRQDSEIKGWDREEVEMHEAADLEANTEHFVIQRIADGVYAAVAREDGAAFCNSGIVDLGTKTLVFDTFETPQAAADLALAAEQLTGRPATYVANSHFHPDHWFGNQAFAGEAIFIATHGTRERMFEVADEMRVFQQEPARLEEILSKNRAELESARDERRQATLRRMLTRMQYALELLPSLEFRFPDQTFERRLVFHGTARRAELIDSDGGHTSSDAYLVLPDDGILFMGDLGFFQREPYMTHCDPLAWLEQLEKMERSNVETFVPGHGPVGGKADIAEQQQYMLVLQALVAHVLQTGGGLEEALAEPLPHPFDTWSAEGLGLAENVRVLYECLNG